MYFANKILILHLRLTLNVHSYGWGVVNKTRLKNLKIKKMIPI